MTEITFYYTGIYYYFKESKFQLMWFGANYPYSFIGFGFPREHGSYKSWLLKDPDTLDFEIWASNRWSHLCFSYQKRNGYVSVVKVRF